MELHQIAREANQTSREHGWYDPEQPPRSFGDLCMLFTSEISEAFEQFRDGRALDEIYWKCSECGREASTPIGQHMLGNVSCVGVMKPEGVPIELADVWIRMGDTIYEEGIPIERALTIKMNYNHNRAYRHGGKRL